MRTSLPRDEVEAIIAAVSALDREPLSEDVLLRAVVAERFQLEITERRTEKGYLRFRSTNRMTLTTISVEDGPRYHCWGYDIQQGDTSEWDAKATSELVWMICGRPLVAKPKAAG